MCRNCPFGVCVWLPQAGRQDLSTSHLGLISLPSGVTYTHLRDSYYIQYRAMMHRIYYTTPQLLVISSYHYVDSIGVVYRYYNLPAITTSWGILYYSIEQDFCLVSRNWTHWYVCLCPLGSPIGPWHLLHLGRVWLPSGHKHTHRWVQFSHTIPCPVR